jgi:hypothetical protein
MFKSKKHFWLFGGISILGIFFGLLIHNEDIPQMTSHECRVDAAIVFVGSLGFILLAWIMEQIGIRMGRFFARAAGRRPSFYSNFSVWGDPFFHYISWFFLFFGIGLAISAFWRDPNRFWEGLVFFAAGIGLLIGCSISKWLSTKLDARRNF